MSRQINQSHRATLPRKQSAFTCRSGSDSRPRTKLTACAENQPARLRPTVVLAKGLLPIIVEYVNACRRDHGSDTEAGGMFVGEYAGTDGFATFKLNGIIEAGPGAELSPTSILFDSDYQLRMLQTIRLQYPDLGNMGCFHRHPGKWDTCSAGDKRADIQAVKDSDTKALVFAIITLDRSNRDPLSVYYENFKIDFYVMAEQTGYEYVRVRPQLKKIPVVRPCPPLQKLAQTRGSSHSVDLFILRRLPGIKQISLQPVERASQTSLLVSARLLHPRATVRLLLAENGALEVFLQPQGGEVLAVRGPWEDPDTGPHIWLSHLLLLVASRLSGANAAVRYRRHYAGLLQDKPRLVAEVRAMEEKFGSRALLRYSKNRLLWEYTVVESGRHFPIEICYPRSYPFEPPRIFSVLPLPPSPHQLVGNELCWLNRLTGRGDWDPARDTAAVCVMAAHRWFACLLVFLTVGQWPEGANEETVPEL